MADEAGNMNRENFLALGTKTKLVDFKEGRAEADTPEHTPTKHPHHHGHQRRVGHMLHIYQILCIIL